MSNSSIGKGHCLCGKVQVTANSLNHHVGACHCRACRRWTGGPFLALDCGTDVIFDGEEHIKIYDSSDWAERGFCSNCGNHLFYRLKGNNKYMMPVGIFSHDENFVFKHQVFIDEKPDYYSFSNETKKMTGSEAFERYAKNNSK